jgi:hypothetical protein
MINNKFNIFFLFSTIFPTKKNAKYTLWITTNFFTFSLKNLRTSVNLTKKIQLLSLEWPHCQLIQW